MIKVLSKHIADKIAAGEVVDRPVSIVKELVENAIDSGANSITVEINDGGKSYIRVTDNGSGIGKDEVETAFLRHATSKISSAKDLDDIRTLGFRGEALASIAAVSHVELISKTTSSLSGVMLNIHGGNIFDKKSTGCPEGTTIVVTKLFYNIPARLKFLKSSATEGSLIIDLISKLALAYDNIKFKMINNGTILFNTKGNGDRLQNILTVYSKSISEHLMKVVGENPHMALEAYISKPDFSKSNRKQQIFFVNGRLINSKVIENAVEEGYKERLFEGRYPVIYVFLYIDPDMIDVNIHPNKREIRFHDESGIKSFISENIRKTLLSMESMPEVGIKNISIPVSENSFVLKSEPSLAVFDSVVREDSHAYISDIKKLSSTILEEEAELEDVLKRRVEENPQLFHSGEQETWVSKDNSNNFFKNLQVSGVVFSTYITGVFENNFYLIDQHAAHERIFYEKFLKEYHSDEKIHQTILTPIIKEVPYTLKASEEIWVSLLKKSGYNIESFGTKTYIINEIPVFMELSEAETVLDYFLDNIKDNRDIDNNVKINKLISRSCKAAVKGNDKLSMEEIKYLIKDLSLCENPYSCPHGRPTFIKMSKYDIEKMFKRV